MFSKLIIEKEKIKISNSFFYDLYLSTKYGEKKLFKKELVDTKSIFIHIPKAAGRSVSTALYNRDNIGHYYLNHYKKANGNMTDEFFKFSFVRDPLTRLYSAYDYLCSGGGNKFDKIIGDRLNEETKNFDDFVVNWLNQDNLYSWFHFVPQHKYLMVDGEVSVDYIGRFENIAEDFDEIKKHVGVNCSLPSVNIGNKSGKKINIGNEAKGIVKELYKLDYTLFGYE